MKFTDGFWMLRDGITASYPAMAYDVLAQHDHLIVHAPTRLIESREDMTRDPLSMITLTFTSPLPDVIGVEITHLTGGREKGPRFDIADGAASEVSVRADASKAMLTSGALSAHVARGKKWRVDFIGGGRPMTSSGPESMAVIETESGDSYIREQLTLDPGTFVYGLGERFGPLVKNGQRVDIWNADGGTTTEQAYKNVPFFLTTSGYGVFVDDPGRTSFEVASEHVSRVQFSVPGKTMRYFVIYGPSPKEILRKYTALTGRPARLPEWSFGLWLSTSFTTSYDEKTVTSFIDGMQERALPLSVFHFDCFWMRELSWCDFHWDSRVFPDPRGMLRRLKERGLRICVWISPYIGQFSPLFKEGKEHGYLLRRPNGDVWQWDRWQPGLAVVDLTNPAAREWWTQKLEPLLDMGVDCFKTDFGERIPTDVEYFDGSDPVSESDLPRRDVSPKPVRPSSGHTPSGAGSVKSAASKPPPPVSVSSPVRRFCPPHRADRAVPDPRFNALPVL